MLSARSRLRRRADFTLAVRRGRRAGRPSLVVHLARAETPAPAPQVGFVVGRAVGAAVERNRVRRRLRHLVRPWLERLPESSVVVVRALPAAAGRSSRELGADLDAALKRLVPA